MCCTAGACLCCFFFFQAEDGIRDWSVTGVQTCALPILDGLPMTLWASFERFGGYAAGLFTGLMGYAQVYWDRNRQAIQDKISETVVIRLLPGAPVPAA